jgi:hypothetical protein
MLDMLDSAPKRQRVNALQAPPSPAALKLRRHRARKRAGRISLTIEADRHALADLLVEQGFLRQWDDDSPAAIRAALETAIAVWTTYAP